MSTNLNLDTGTLLIRLSMLALILGDYASILGICILLLQSAVRLNARSESPGQQLVVNRSLV
jgi:hypothetical protein